MTFTFQTSRFSMTPQHNIKRGVSLYSYQYETFLRKMTLDDCIAHAARPACMATAPATATWVRDT